MKADAAELAARQGWDPSQAGPCSNGVVAILNGRVYARTTFNLNAAISTAADQVREVPPYELTGTGITVGVWDKGSVRPTHQEFGGRVSVKDTATPYYHSTHVGGTIAAAGVVASAKGMAPAARVDSYDWDYDLAEMAERAMALPGESNTLQLANQSYGYQCGWSGGTWYGTWGARESDGFGLYDSSSAELDAICDQAPYFLPFKAAGNDRNDSAPSPGQSFSFFSTNGWETKAYDPAVDPPSDNWDNGGYDTLAYDASAKNIVSVGSVADAVAGGRRSLDQAAMSWFSSWGPTDDGRVKPDLVANGEYVFSTSSFSDQDYRTMSGTSMATPNAAGSAALLADLYRRLFPGQAMRASTLKGLLIHTADDLGNPGPDYQFGWGLINARAAADQLLAHQTRTNALRVVEGRLTTAVQSREYSFFWDSVSPIRATLCWTDPPGETRATLDDRAAVLVNDLDLRVIDPAGREWQPFVLDVENPSEPATTGDNNRDNVEQVLISPPTEPGRYRVVVQLDGELSARGFQDFSLLVSGSAVSPEIEHVPLLNTTNDASPYTVDVRITCESALATNACAVFWNTTGSRSVFSEIPLRQVSNELFRASLPARPRGSKVFYFIRARAANGLSSYLPAGASETLFCFAVTPPVGLTVAGAPAPLGSVEPAYGTWQYATGLSVRVNAGPLTETTNGVRYTCIGWTGTGSVPSQGSSNALEFVISQPSTITWQWDHAFELRQTSSVPGLVQTSVWWRAGARADTVEAPREAPYGGTSYCFIGWYVDGERQPAPGMVASNPAVDIPMSTSYVARAEYLPAGEDADGNGVSDWWEYLHFGTTNSPLDLDSDGDGFSNLKEFQDDTNPQDSSSVPQPPSVAHVPLSTIQGFPAPWPVTAVVTDNRAVADVSLEWRRNGGAWQTEGMSTGAVPSRYDAAIPAPGVTGDHFEYRIAARDTAGLRSVNGSYALDVVYPVAGVMPADFGTLYLAADSTLRTAVTITNAGHANLVWSLTAQPIGLSDGAESGTNGWTHDGVNDAWHISTNRAHSGNCSWYFGVDAQRGYPDSAKAQLVSAPLHLAGGARLAYWQWLSTEDLKDATHAWDGAVVEISTNDGASFEQIAPVGGYPYVIFGHPASGFPDNTPCFAGTGGWQRVEFDLSAYAGRAVRVRFFFGSDGYVVNEGWFIDDMEITPYGGPVDWLSVNRTNGLTLAHELSHQLLMVDSTNLAPAETRSALLWLRSNDPVTPELAVPIALHNISRDILVMVRGEGSVTPSGRVRVTAGETKEFQVQAAVHHHVIDLLTNGVSAVSAPLAVEATNFVWPAITESGTLLAVFAANLTTNSVPEGWLADHGLTNDYEAEAMGDQDADGMAAWEEYVAGTDPTNAGSRLWLGHIDPYGTNYVRVVEDDLPGTWYTQVLLQAQGSVLAWSSVSNRRYTVYGADSVSAAPFVIASNVPATPPINSYTDVVGGASHRFYRLGVIGPQP